MDLIPVDVQVVNGAGQPILGLTADKFEVTINGRRRRVVSASLVDYRPLVFPPQPEAGAPAAAAPAVPANLPDGGRRIFILAIDCASFDEATGRPILQTAAEFVRRLAPTDEVGLFAYPIGPKVDPTTDHAAVIRALDAIVARRDVPPRGRFGLSPADLVELSMLPLTEAGRALTARFCGAPPDQDLQCAEELAQEVRGQVLMFEGIAQAGIATLQDLMRELGKVPDRKTLVLVSGGVLSADRPGARPDNHLLGVEAGRIAAQANVNVYTLYVDQQWMRQMSAETGRAPSSTSPALDSALVGKWLDEFSGNAGGALLKVLAGNAVQAFGRVLTETSTYYLLGVEPQSDDRDGRPHELRVRVSERSANVRGRSWVIVPKLGEVTRAAALPRLAAPAPGTAPVPSTRPPVSPAVRALADAFERDDRSALAMALAPRNADTLIETFRTGESPWPSAPRKTAVFALDLALAGLRTESPFTRNASFRLLAEYAVRVRQGVADDVFECTWLWTATAGLQGLFSPEAGAVIAERAIERCPADPSARLALAVVRHQQWIVNTPASAGRGSVAAPIDDGEQRVLDAYAAAAVFPSSRYEARLRAAQMHARAGRYAEGMALLEGLSNAGEDSQVRYLGSLVRGQLLRGLGRRDDAMASFRAALQIWPGGQAARVALMTLVGTHGSSDEAAELAESIVAAPTTTGDPWWLYYLGDFREFTAIRARLRALAP